MVHVLRRYPEEAPDFEVEESGDNVDEEVLSEFETFVRAQIEENLGMVLVFTVVSAAIEWLGAKSEELRVRRAEEAAEKKEREEEAERVRCRDREFYVGGEELNWYWLFQKRFEGTRVTLENFLTWKRQFDEDKARERAAKLAKVCPLTLSKLTFLTIDQIRLLMYSV